MNSIPLHTNPLILNYVEELDKNLNKVWIEKLSNGLTVHYEHRKDPNSSHPILCIYATVKAGFNVEDTSLDENGISHLLEHALFLGTKSYSKDQIQDLLNECGCPMGADSNATTSFNNTSYKFNRIKPDNAASILHLLYEMVSQASFPVELIGRERVAVLDEVMRRKSGHSKLIEHIETCLSDGCSISKRFKDLANLTEKVKACEAAELVQILQGFYKKWYQPHLMGVFIVGDMGNEEKAIKFFEHVKQLFSQITSADEQSKSSLPTYIVPNREQALYSIFTHNELDSKISIFRKKKPSISQPCVIKQNAKLMARSVFINSILQSLFSILLDNKQPLKYVDIKGTASENVSADYHYYLELQCKTKDQKDLKKIFEIFLKALKTIKTYGFTKKQFIEKQHELMRAYQEHLEKIPGFPHSRYINTYVTDFNKGMPLTFEKRNILIKLKVLENLSFEQATFYTKKFWDIFDKNKLNQLNVFVIHSHPLDQETIHELKESHLSIEAGFIPTKNEETEVKMDWLPTNLKPKSILSSHSTIETDLLTVEEVCLENGLKVYFHKTEESGQSILFKLIEPTGKSTLTPIESQKLILAFNVIRACGYSSYPIQDLIFPLKAKSVSPIITFKLENYASIIEMEATKPETVETILQLLYSRLKDLTYLDTEHFSQRFDFIKKGNLQAIDNKKNLPQEKFNKAYKHLIYQNQPFYCANFAEAIESMTADECKDILIKYIENLTNCSLVVSGNIAKETLFPLLQLYVGNLPHKIHEVSPIRWDMKADLHKQSVNLFDNSESYRTQVSMSYILSIDKQKILEELPFINEQFFKVYINVTNQVLSEYLNQIVRFEKQETYALAVAVNSLFLNNSNYGIDISYVSPTQNYSLIRQSIIGVFQELQSGILNREKLEKIINSIREKYSKNAEQNASKAVYWHSDICNAIIKDRQLKSIIDKKELLQNLNTEHVISFLLKFLSQEKVLKEVIMHSQAEIEVLQKFLKNKVKS